MRPYAHIKRTAYFNPRSPRGGATFSLPHSSPFSLNFNPRSPRGGATLVLLGLLIAAEISIHAPHEGERQLWKPQVRGIVTFQSTLPTRGSDTKAVFSSLSIGISIHAPHEGERPGVRLANLNPGIFQSTLPTRGSDLLPVAAVGIDLHFNPRSPRGGATLRREHFEPRVRAFQSTLPTRGSDAQ